MVNSADINQMLYVISDFSKARADNLTILADRRSKNDAWEEEYVRKLSEAVDTISEAVDWLKEQVENDKESFITRAQIQDDI
mgnify:CR=1 FL=1